MQHYKIAELLGSTLTPHPKEVICNLPSYVLPETEKALLSTGLHFAMPPKN